MPQLKRLAQLQDQFNQLKEARLKAEIEKNERLAIKQIPVRGSIGPKGESGRDGKDGKDFDWKDVPKLIEMVIEAVIERINKGNLLDYKALKNKPLISASTGTRMGGGGPTFYTETPSGTTNGVNLTFTLTYGVNTGYNSIPIVWLTVNGKFLIANTHFTISGRTLTISNAADAPQAGNDFSITYATNLM